MAEAYAPARVCRQHQSLWEMNKASLAAQISQEKLRTQQNNEKIGESEQRAIGLQLVAVQALVVSE